MIEFIAALITVTIFLLFVGIIAKILGDGLPNKYFVYVALWPIPISILIIIFLYRGIKFTVKTVKEMPRSINSLFKE